jgi:hypothetical protein
LFVPLWTGDHRPPGNPTCSLDRKLFLGGVDGYCEETGEQQFSLRFVDSEGSLLFDLRWPDDVKPARPPVLPVVDCELLCEAGLMEVMESARKMLPPGGPTISVPRDPGDERACYVAKNARQEYTDCYTGEMFGCFLACGAGCVGCNVTVFWPDCGPEGTSCSGRRLRCYTRPCCTEHDQALRDASTASTWRQRKAHNFIAHMNAFMNGCGLDDASGDTWDEEDATCLDFDDLCLVD